MGCDDGRMGTYDGRLVSTLVLDRPVRNETRVVDDAAVVLSSADGRLRIVVENLELWAEVSDNVGFELSFGQTQAVTVDGRSLSFEIEGAGQVTSRGALTFVFIGHHADGATTLEFNGVLRR